MRTSSISFALIAGLMPGSALAEPEVQVHRITISGIGSARIVFSIKNDTDRQVNRYQVECALLDANNTAIAVEHTNVENVRAGETAYGETLTLGSQIGNIKPAKGVCRVISSR